MVNIFIKSVKSTERDISLGVRLRELRAFRQLTQKELADKINSSNVEISNYEKGAGMTVSTLKKILRILDIDSSYFFESEVADVKEFVKSQEGQDIIEALYKLPSDDRKAILRFIHSHAYVTYTKNYKATRRSG